jgi:hypothetical protein
MNRVIAEAGPRIAGVCLGKAVAPPGGCRAGREANWLGGGLAYRPPVGGVVAGVVGGVLVGGVLVGGVLAAAWATYSVIAWPLATTVCGFGFMLSTVLGVALLVW